ncbi:MAG: type I-B CRISPR-associated protein Cas8b1/Cst1 [Tissierellia bacterium]|nr:type I-B CRISPR-associated protein Cas8b1/Cst1 [Tissierellia bacterium]
MSEKIRVSLADWQFNAGVVGLFNILKHAGDQVVVKKNYLEFESECLEKFEIKYFNYLIDKYWEVLSINKIISIEKFISYYEENDFEEFDDDSLEAINKYINDVKRYLKSNSYKSAYDLIDSTKDWLILEKKLKTIKLKKKQDIDDIIPEIKGTFDVLKQIIEFAKAEESRKYIGAKNVIYTIVNNAWDGVCFLNRQTKEKDMYIDYKNYFVVPIIEYLEADKSEFKYTCFSCDREMKDFNNDLSFLVNTGFDVSRKTSHVWDFQNDVAVCPICKLVYSCVPAGISYIYNNGIYVNDNSNVENAININNKIFKEIYKQKDEDKKLTYRALVNAINKEYSDKIKYELADIQLVRYENGKYRFNILSRKSLEVIRDSKIELDRLINCSFKEINTYFNIYELVIDRLLNTQNMFTLVQKLLYYKLSAPKNCYYNAFHVLNILDVNTKFMRGVGYMKHLEKDIVKLGNTSGYYLRERYRNKGSIDKLSGISYRLLNALKTNNVASFMDTLLNCYLYAKLPVPEVFVDALRNEEQFKTIGYAFVAGLIEGEKNVENGGEVNEK